MLCAKYQEAGLSGSREKCDRNYLVSKYAYVHDIQSREIFVTPTPTMQDDRSDPYMSPLLKRAGDTINC